MCKILGLFVNGLTADDKCSFVNKGNLMESIHMHLSKKQKNIFWIFFVHFWSLNQILNILKKKTTLIPYVFWKLQTAKEALGQVF